jgi:hypothetical protein
MLIELKRDPSTDGCTLGKLFVDGQFECFTLEDLVREVPGQPVAQWKIQNQTAIPTGTYKVIVDFSDHFQKQLPHILNVPGFDGVRIHSGNTADDTEGCILVGGQQGNGEVLDSRNAFAALFPKIQAAIAQGQPVQLSISNFQAQRETSVA